MALGLLIGWWVTTSVAYRASVYTGLQLVVCGGEARDILTEYCSPIANGGLCSEL